MSNFTLKGTSFTSGGQNQPTGGTTNFLSGQSTGGLNLQNKPTSGFFSGGATGTSGLGGTSLGGIGLTSTTSNKPSGFGGMSSLTGNKPTGGLGGVGISSNQPPSSGFFGLPIQNQNQMSMMTQTDKKEYFIGEIIHVIQNYISSLSTNSSSNAFKAMLYNRVPKGNENQIENLMVYCDKKIGEEGEELLIDYNMWVKALQNNPNKQLFYPCQVSSPTALFRRIKTSQMFLYSALELIVQLQNKLGQLNDQYDNEIENLISLIKKKLSIIKTMELRVISKIERVALIVGMAETNYNMENHITNRLNGIKTMMSESNEYTDKIKELSGLLSVLGNESQVLEETDIFKDFDKVRLEKNVNILTDLKKIFDVTLGGLKENLATVNFISNDLEKLKKYGKIPK